MSDFKQMLLIDRDDAAGAANRLESERELAAVAWSIVSDGAHSHSQSRSAC